MAEDSVLVDYDAASLGNRFPAFRRDKLPSSRYRVIDSRRFETTQGLRNTGIHHTTRRHIPEQHSPQSVRSFAFISFCKFNTPLQRRRRRLQCLLRLNIISITDPAVWTTNHKDFTIQDYPLISNTGLLWKKQTFSTLCSKSKLNSLWFLLVGVYQRQSFRSSTSGKFKRTETTHQNSCCKCWRGYAQVCLDRIRLSYWYLSCDKRLTHRTFIT